MRGNPKGAMDDSNDMQQENRLVCTWRSGPFGLSGLDGVAEGFSRLLESGDVIAVQAPMGTGKTTFVAALARVMGALDAASSPTFALCQEYPLGSSGDVEGVERALVLRHLDLYRIGSDRELLDLGWEEWMEDGRAITLVEWPERAADHFPDRARVLRIEQQPDGLRLASLWVRESV